MGFRQNFKSKIKPYTNSDTLDMTNSSSPDDLFSFLEKERVDPVSNRTFGEAGAGLEETFGEKGKVGAIGEKKTAAILQTLAQDKPNVFVFHSLKLPSQNWDIDHIVLHKNLLIIVDDKQWAHNQNYKLTRTPPAGLTHKPHPYTCWALKNGEHFPRGELKPHFYQKQIKELFPKLTIMSLVVIHGHKITLKEETSNYKFGFINSFNLENRLTYLSKKYATEDIKQDKTEKIIGQLQSYADRVDKKETRTQRKPKSLNRKKRAASRALRKVTQLLLLLIVVAFFRIHTTCDQSLRSVSCRRETIRNYDLKNRGEGAHPTDLLRFSSVI